MMRTMEPMNGTPLLGRLLLIAGLLIAGIGLLLMMGPRLPFLGRLPGDLAFGRGHVRVYIPLMTSLVLSVILTLIFSLLSIFRR
jgi:hypothetical protein